jgi:cysteine desulfurase / selenocysteine lyase
MEGAGQMSATTQAKVTKDWRDAWFEFDDVAYLNISGQSPLPKVAIRAAQQAIAWKKYPHKMPQEVFFGLPGRVRASIAKLIGAEPDEIAVTTGASTGMAAVANAYAWKADDEVLVAKGEFPSHFTTWLPLHDAGKLRVKIVSPSGRFITTDDLIAAITPKTRIISVSMVRFDNAVLCDVPRLAGAAKQVGAMILLDVAQAAGSMKIDAKTLGADFVVGAGYKFLLGPFGTGFFWACADRIAEMSASPAYWMAVENASEFHKLSAGEVKLKKAAQRWDAAETSSFFNLAPWAESLEFLVNAGAETVAEHNRELVRQIIERLPLDRCVLASPADETQRGSYVCVAARVPERTPELYKKLTDAGVITSLREGAIRIAPFLYNTERDVDQLIRTLTV